MVDFWKNMKQAVRCIEFVENELQICREVLEHCTENNNISRKQLNILLYKIARLEYAIGKTDRQPSALDFWN